MLTTHKLAIRALAGLLAGMALSTLACGDGATGPPATPTPSAVWVTPATVELSALGDTARLSADVRDQHGQAMAGAAVAWASEAPEVATVDGQGLVTAVGNGSATITASAGSASGNARTWVAQEVRAVSVSAAGPVLVGDTVRLVAETQDANGHAVAGSEFSWASSDTTVATVDASGLVTGLAAGEAEVTATSSGTTGGVEVAVRAAGAVSVSPSREAIALGDTLRLVAVALDENGQPLAGASFTWSSSRPEVASVDPMGLVTGVAAGSATITATGAGAAGSADIAVLDRAVGAVSVSPSREAIALGDTVRLVAEALDENGQPVAGVPFTWSSSRSEVASVDPSGLVTGVAAGSATITATGAGAAGSADIAVLDRAVGAVSVSPSREAIALGDTVRLVAEALDENGQPVAGVPFTWSSSRSEVASVDPSGLVTGVAAGSATITATGAGAAGSADIAVIDRDRAALIALYEATDGPNWVNNENWLTDAPLGAWYGVGTDGSGRVTRLNLRGLTGPLPPELGELAKLERLYLSNNELSGAIPPELGSLANLEHLDLDLNRLTGLIPRKLGGLANLEYLGLGGNGLTGAIPRELGGLANLRTLNLGGNGLTGAIPQELGGLANLEYLSLSVNGLTGAIPSALGGLANLEHLDLDLNRLTGLIPRELGGLANLEYLSLYGNDLWGAIPRELGGLANLRTLGLGENGLSGAIPRELGGLANLRTLDLPRNGLTGGIPRELGGLANLEYLNLGGNGLTGAIPRELGGLANLENLGLHENGLTGGIPRELGGLANLRTLYLDGNNLTGAIPPELGGLANLRDFAVNGNDIRGPVPLSFMKLPLQSFNWDCGMTRVCMPGTSVALGWLDGVQWKGPFCNASDQAVLSNLFELTSGDRWTASAGWLGSPALEQWHGVRTDRLGRVTALDLSDNGLAGGLPSDIGRLEGLRTLRIDGNALFGRLPLSLADLYLDDFHYGDTELCAPADDAFRAWLGGIGSLDGTGTECATLTDRDILKALYEATGGPNWVNGRNWLSGAQLRHWHGVAVDGQDRVVGLDLARNELSGLIPRELGGLANLESLDLSWNGLTGAIPSALGGLANLERLNLDHNRLTGLIPRELGDLANLESLALGSNDLTGLIPRELGGLANLRTLYLSWNGLTGAIPQEVGGLANLRTLYLYGNDLSGAIPRELGGLANLEYLSLGGNGLTGAIPRELGGLANLRTLYLEGNGLTGAIPWELGGLSNLRTLSMSANELTGRIPRGLGGLSNLRTLSMSANELTGPVPPEFGGLAALTVLDLARNRDLAGAIPAGLKDLRLASLQAGSTDLCVPLEPGFDAWLANIPDRRIAVCGNGLAAYLVQAVQSQAHPVPLVAGEDALLRVFVTAARQTSEGMPAVRARFYLGGVERHVAEIPANSNSIPTEVDEGDLSKSANADIPGRIVRPGLEMVVEVDPDGTLDPALGVPRRIPEAGRVAVAVRELPVLQLTAIPFLWSADPDRVAVEAAEGMEADPEGHDLLEDTRVLLPVGRLEVTAHGPVQSTSNDAYDLLSQTEAIRVLEGGGGHYAGLMSGTVTGPAGVAYLGGRSSFSAPHSGTIAHELGHNMGLGHAPCGTRGDPSYPYADGSIGSWGYDFRKGRLVPPSLHKDLMSYCGPDWISDYHFTNALRHRLRDEGEPSAAGDAPAATSLLLWGGIDGEGNLFLNPAFVAEAPTALPDSAGDYAVSGRDAGGGELFSVRFAMPRVPSEEPVASSFASFAFALPVRPGWEDLATITLSGPDGEAALDGDSDVPMAIVRDSRTGQVRAILRDAPAASVTGAAADAFGGARVPRDFEVLFSRGIPGSSAWRR